MDFLFFTPHDSTSEYYHTHYTEEEELESVIHLIILRRIWTFPASGEVERGHRLGTVSCAQLVAPSPAYNIIVFIYFLHLLLLQYTILSYY